MVEAQAQFNNGEPITCEFIRGARIEDCFKNPRRKKAIVIGCSEYANLRNLTGKGYGDINEALDDIKIVRQGLKQLLPALTKATCITKQILIYRIPATGAVTVGHKLCDHGSRGGGRFDCQVSILCSKATYH